MPAINPFTNFVPDSTANAYFRFIETHKFSSSQLTAVTKPASHHGYVEYIGQIIYLEPKYVKARDKSQVLTFVLDLDSTLIDSKFRTHKSKYYIRPYARMLLDKISSLKNIDGSRQVELILWSAGTFEHVAIALSILDPEQQIFDYVIARGQWNSCSAGKDLAQLVGRKNTCIILDDTDSMVSINKVNALLIDKFTHKVPSASRDKSLHIAMQVMMWLANIVITIEHYRCKHKLQAQSPYLSHLHLELDTSSQHILSSIVRCGLEFNVGDFVAKHPAVTPHRIDNNLVLKINAGFECSARFDGQAVVAQLFEVVAGRRWQSSVGLKRPLLHIAPLRAISHNEQLDNLDCSVDGIITDRPSKRLCKEC